MRGWSNAGSHLAGEQTRLKVGVPLEALLARGARPLTAAVTSLNLWG